ncbi:MAG: bifunctional hydroxymethylpyrimidine kinase/phosphomethylpyrimidine kinase [Planctomycetes bacterium]|nr:bifunctional hydroxymethylpyrimidine kinase/phosphomethylpyrimidine kinase [Planctomycetota bacterium]
MNPRLLVLGGVDPCGGAGITADALVAAHHGARALPVPLVLTEQNRRGFRRAHAVDELVWGGMLDAVLGDGEVHAVKVGLLADAAQLRCLVRRLSPLRGRVPIVVDPVLSATAGGLDAGQALAVAYRDDLAAMGVVLTPNAPELVALAAGDPAVLLRRGATAVLRKGGHDEGECVVDELVTASGRVAFRRRRLAVGRVHGTGCALATGIASLLAAGAPLATACERAGAWLFAQLEALGPAPAGPASLPRDLPFVQASR